MARKILFEINSNKKKSEIYIILTASSAHYETKNPFKVNYYVCKSGQNFRTINETAILKVNKFF